MIYIPHSDVRAILISGRKDNIDDRLVSTMEIIKNQKHLHNTNILLTDN